MTYKYIPTHSKAYHAKKTKGRSHRRIAKHVNKDSTPAKIPVKVNTNRTVDSIKSQKFYEGKLYVLI